MLDRALNTPLCIYSNLTKLFFYFYHKYSKITFLDLRNKKKRNKFSIRNSRLDVFWKIETPKILKNLQEIIRHSILFLTYWCKNNLQIYRNTTPTWIFSQELSEIFGAAYCSKHLQTADSIHISPASANAAATSFSNNKTNEIVKYLIYKTPKTIFHSRLSATFLQLREYQKRQNENKQKKLTMGPLESKLFRKTKGNCTFHK